MWHDFVCRHKGRLLFIRLEGETMKSMDLYGDNASVNQFNSKAQTLRILVISDPGIKVWCTSILRGLFMEQHVNTDIRYLDFRELNDEQNCDIVANCEYLLVWIPFQSICEDYKNEILSHRIMTEDVLALLKEKYRALLTIIQKYNNSIRTLVAMEDYSDNMEYCSCMFYNSYKIADSLNAWLYENYKQSYKIMDIKHMIALLGIGNAFDFEMNIKTGFRYSSKLLSLVCKNMLKHYLVERKTPYKCIVLDCDNVLWGGIISEVGIDGIRIGKIGAGKRYYEFQKVLLSLYYQGIVLAICSKNDKEDVLNVFDNHTGMILKRDNIAFFSVDWENKAKGICNISECLGISLEQIVFIDDSVTEIEGIKWLLPEVKSILFDPRDVYKELACICVEAENDINTVELRNKTYQDNIRRIHMRQLADNYEDYLMQLDMKVSFFEMTPTEFQRVSELSRRANRFTNGRRVSVIDLQELSKKGKLYSIYVSDKYGDLGLSGAIVVVDTTLELVCMSCRAEGRNVEGNIREFLENNLFIDKMYKLDTGKNQNFLEFIGNIIR